MTMPAVKYRYSPSNEPVAPAPSGTRASAPPRWRSSANISGAPGWMWASKASSAASSSSPKNAPSLREGIGSSGSMWMRLSATAGTIAQVSSSGSSARSAAIASAPGPASPANAPSITATERPRRKSGSSGSGGKCMTRIDVVTSSGAVRVQSRQTRSTSPARS